MKRNRRTIRQGQLFEPDGPGTVLEGGCEKHMLDLLTQLIREAARTLTAGEGGGDEQDHA